MQGHQRFPPLLKPPKSWGGTSERITISKKAAFGEAAFLKFFGFETYNINSLRVNIIMPLKKSFLYT